MDNKLFAPTIAACAACIEACNSCITACTGVKNMEDIIELCTDCISQCNYTIGECNNKTSYANECARVCADTVRAASAACSKCDMKECKAAVPAMNACETACKKLGLQ